jgi:hypothetical protein
VAVDLWGVLLHLGKYVSHNTTLGVFSDVE